VCGQRHDCLSLSSKMVDREVICDSALRQLVSV